MHLLQTAALILLLQSAAPQTLQTLPTEKASIEGIVLRASSGEPLGRAQVRLSRVMSEEETGFFVFDPSQVSEIPPFLTEADGKFIFKDIDPGPYRLTVQRNGYSEQAFGQKSPTTSGSIINLAPGERSKNIDFRLVQGGVITGRIRDSAGEPVAGLNVSLMQLRYSGDDGRRVMEAVEQAVTDDRGEYRFYWIAPGRYFISAIRNPYSYQPRVVFDRVIPTTYYPGVPDPSQASFIEVSPGAELGAIDIVLPQASGYRIKGRVIDASTGKPPKSANVELGHRQRKAIVNPTEENKAEYNPSNGDFEMRNVSPGAYWLSASLQSDFSQPLSESLLADVRAGDVRTGADVFETVFRTEASTRIPIDMLSSDLNGVILTLTKGAVIPVRLIREDQPFSLDQGLDSVRVSLIVPDSYFLGGGSTRPSSEGMTRIEGVNPGEYRVQVWLAQAKDFYVKEIRYGRIDALRDTLQISEQSPEALTVLLSTRGGIVEGILHDALSQPLSGVDVMLIPDRRDEKDLYRKVTTDREGRFVFRSLAPGGYKVFSWEALESNAYYDAEVLARYEIQGEHVQVQESSKETVDLKIIPPPRQ